MTKDDISIRSWRKDDEFVVNFVEACSLFSWKMKRPAAKSLDVTYICEGRHWTWANTYDPDKEVYQYDLVKNGKHVMRFGDIRSNMTTAKSEAREFWYHLQAVGFEVVG